MILLLLSPSISAYQNSFSASHLKYCLITETSQSWKIRAARSWRWNRLVFALYCLGCNMIYGIWPVHGSDANGSSHLKANLKNKQYVIATYFHLWAWKQIFIGNGFLISIEMNMMTDNEYMPPDVSLPSQNNQVWRHEIKKKERLQFLLFLSLFFIMCGY